MLIRHAAVIVAPLVALSISLLIHPTSAQQPAAPPPHGAAEAWHRLQKLTTTASLLHTTAHPDDEQGAMLAAVSRGEGAHTALLTLNRGEAGDNAIGPELFDALGLIRTEELRLAGRFYGLDAQYYTRLADYGYSKRLDEALEQWDRTVALGDMLRVIRRERPLVVVSRWQGNERDGHGQHQAAGALTPEAVRLAGDPAAFPEQLREEGLRPWRVPRLYIGGVRAGEPSQVAIETGRHEPLLAATFFQLGRMGLAVQRSQTSGRYDPFATPQPLLYREAGSPAAGGVAASFFTGLDTRVSGMYPLLGRTAPSGHAERLVTIEGHVQEAIAAFTAAQPSRSVGPLGRGLAAVLALHADTSDPDVRFLLERKISQFEQALLACAGIEVAALAESPDAGAAGSPSPFAPPPLLEPLTPGDRARVRIAIVNRGLLPMTIEGVHLDDRYGSGSPAHPPGTQETALGPGAVWTGTLDLNVPQDHETSLPYFARSSIEESHYTVKNRRSEGRPHSSGAFDAVAALRFGTTRATVRVPVLRRESALPYGYELRELEVLPPVSVSIAPSLHIVRPGHAGGPVHLAVAVANRTRRPLDGEVRLEAPDGWRVSPASHRLNVAAAGAATQAAFEVRPGPLGNRAHEIRVVARVNGRDYDAGIHAIRQRDLGLQYLERPAVAKVRAVDVQTVPDLRVGYVMGVGDELPAAIRALGAAVDLLDAAALASAPLDHYDTVVTGTRAYAVRADLRAHNQRLLEYVRGGGNLVVLYNTPEFAPEEFAPLPASLPGNAEEICEEDAPVAILAPDHAVMTRPNRITPADFDGWIEQRGSKFFASWDPGYTPVLSSHDRGQPPQHGGFLTARVGKGHYTYMAYALHRQLPAGVPGAYRLLANLLALGRTDE